MTTIALMTKHSRKPATYQDIIDLPENMVGEIIDGELIVSPRPAVGHALAASVLRIYVREKVRHVWLVDPLSRMLEVFRGHEKGWLLMGVFTEDQRVRAEPFDAIELVLEMLWPVVTSP